MICLIVCYLAAIWMHCPVSSLRADWKEFLDPDSLNPYIGKAHAFFNESLFQGDIANIDGDGLSDEEIADFAANAVTDEKLKWPGNIIPYEISPTFEEHNVAFIKKAMDEMTAMTKGCVKFVEKTIETDYLKLIRSFGCYSAVGRQGGAQKVSLTRGCLEAAGDFQHELMHALGFFHELSRADRDQFVWINWDNIQESNRRQFITMEGTTFGLPYDYSSVMHYSFNAFAINPNLPTILPTKKKIKIGLNERLSAGDVERIRIAYKCLPNSGETHDVPPVTTSNSAPSRRTTTTTSPSPFGPIFIGPVFQNDLKDRADSECRSLDTEYCQVSAPSSGCRLGYLKVVCNDRAIAKNIKAVLQKIADLDRRPRPVILKLNSKINLNKDLFEMIKNELVGLSIFGSKAGLKSLQLPKLVHLNFKNVFELDLNAEDLQGFPGLKVLEFEKTSFSSIEDNVFAKLPELKLLALEKGLSFPIEERFTRSVQMIHCDCKYAWLRKFFSVDFRAPKIEGELYSFGQHKSPPFQTSDMYLPVDCSKPNLQGRKLQRPFSIRLKCSRR